MKLVVIGGHSRNIGKTSVAAAVIAAAPELGWTALKITLFGHNICARDGHPCDCAVNNPEHPFAITREENRRGRSDTARFLAAGAAEAYWVRAPQDRLSEAMPAIRETIAGKPYVVMESNSVLRYLEPDLYLVVLDYNKADFKPSARANLARADAFVLLETSRQGPAWPYALPEGRPVFRVRPPRYWSDSPATAGAADGRRSSYRPRFLWHPTS